MIGPPKPSVGLRGGQFDGVRSRLNFVLEGFQQPRSIRAVHLSELVELHLLSDAIWADD